MHVSGRFLEYFPLTRRVLGCLCVGTVVVLLGAGGCDKAARSPSAQTTPSEKTAPGTLRLISVTPIPTQEVIVASEEFKGDPGMWTWQLTEGTLLPGKGMRFETMDDGHVMLQMPYHAADAASVDRVRVTLSDCTDTQDQPIQPEDVDITLYWARESDVESGKWPFSNDRAVRASPYTEWRDERTAAIVLHTHALWTGKFAKLMMTITYKIGEKAQKVRAGIEKIELVGAGIMKGVQDRVW